MQIRSSMGIPLNLEVPSKIILDTHGGLQDIISIIFAHRYIQNSGSKQQIIGITCVAGKNSLENAVKSAMVANMILGTKIPIYKGQSESLMLQVQYPETYSSQKFTHIEKNLYQQLQAEKDNWEKLVSPQKATDFIIKACQQHKHQIGIAVFGPPTNIALAHRLQESLELVKVLSLTGGQYLGMGNTVKGNVQANFSYDPLAVTIILEEAKKLHLKDRLYINVLEQSLNFCWKLAINSCLDTGKLDLLIDDILVNMMGINSIVLNCGPLLTVLPLLQPKSARKCYHCYAQIIRDGGLLDGLLAINWLKIYHDPTAFDSFFYVYEDYDKELITQLFMTAFVNKQN